ncbi:MAG: LLM class F420-dependent oxidoreductase, partial [Chloroflexi bacterium]|nr:LLM class F420-dependent oxidoreductase [Chloroflexota bacterium]
AVEAMGLTHLLIYDHVVGADPSRFGDRQVPYTKDSMFHEPFVTLGYLAASTTSIELVTGVIILPQRQTVLVAKQAAQVDVLSGGRLRLGIGTGWNHVEYEALNENFHNRGKRQEEQVALLRALWADEVVDFEGTWHTVHQAGINPRPKRPIPIWFGGAHPALIDRAARIGDGWMPQVPADEAAPRSLTSSIDARPPATPARASASRSRRASAKAIPTSGPRLPPAGVRQGPPTCPRRP